MRRNIPGRKTRRVCALGEPAKTVTGTHRDCAVRLVTGAERVVPSIDSEPLMASGLARLAEPLMPIDPDHASQLTADAERIAVATSDATAFGTSHQHRH